MDGHAFYLQALKLSEKDFRWLVDYVADLLEAQGELSVQAPEVFWDPLGYTCDGSVETLGHRRGTEIKQGQVAMYATLGYTVPEYFERLGFLSPSLGLKFSDVPNGLTASITEVPGAGWAQIVALAGYCELFVYKYSGTRGDYGGKVKKKLSAEIANGRLAMMALIGMFYQDGLTGSALGDWAEPGVQPPVGVWDPLCLSASGNVSDHNRCREVELKHGRDPETGKKKLNAELANGRLAMLAIIGMFFQEQKEVTAKSGLENAIAAREMKALRKALAEGEAVGLGQEAEEMQIALETLTLLKKKADAKEQLHRALRSASYDTVDALRVAIDAAVLLGLHFLDPAKAKLATLEREIAAKRELEDALASGGLSDLAAAISRAEAAGLASADEHLTSARQTHAAEKRRVKARQGLFDAIQTRSTEHLRKAIEEGRASGIPEEEVQEASDILSEEVRKERPASSTTCGSVTPFFLGAAPELPQPHPSLPMSVPTPAPALWPPQPVKRLRCSHKSIWAFTTSIVLQDDDFAVCNLSV